MALTLLLRILIFTLFPFDVAVIDSNRRRTLSSVSAVPWGASARIFPSYHHRFGRSTPDYMCQKNCVEQSQPACQPIPGTGIDEAIGQLVVRSVTPLSLEVALNVQSEIQQSLAEAGRLRQQLRVFGAAPERRDQARRGSASKRSPCGSGARRSTNVSLLPPVWRALRGCIPVRYAPTRHVSRQKGCCGYARLQRRQDTAPNLCRGARATGRGFGHPGG